MFVCVFLLHANLAGPNFTKSGMERLGLKHRLVFTPPAVNTVAAASNIINAKIALNVFYTFMVKSLNEFQI